MQGTQGQWRALEDSPALNPRDPVFPAGTLGGEQGGVQEGGSALLTWSTEEVSSSHLQNGCFLPTP